MRQSALLAALVGLATCAGCGDSKLKVAGRVLVDGKPIEEGTIHFESADGSATRSAGGSIRQGQIQFPPDASLEPGDYRVQVQAFSKTGRAISDPQRGEIDEVVPLEIKDLPLEIGVNEDNSADLLIKLSSPERSTRK